MENYVKEYLNSGKTLEDLKSEFGINYRIFDPDMVILSYSQVDSPKTNPIVRMCRGLIIQNKSWNIYSYPFYRFYNINEVPDEAKKIDFSKAVATTKLDGSLIQMFYNENIDQWVIATRSWIGGDNIVSAKINYKSYSFNDLFNMAIAPFSRNEFFRWFNKNYCFTFELTSPFNQIVTPPPEGKTMLHLIGCRSIPDFKELPFYEVWDKFPFELKEIIGKPNIIPLTNDDGSFKNFKELQALANSVGERDEGFVVTDFSQKINGSFPRMKVKNESYVALHHLKGNIENGQINFAEILTTVYKNEKAEIIAYFPEYKNIFDDVEQKWNNFIQDFENVKDSKELEKFWKTPINERIDKNIKKEFAMIVTTNKFKRYQTLFFLMFNKNFNSLKEIIESNKKSSLTDSLKYLWDTYVIK